VWRFLTDKVGAAVLAMSQLLLSNVAGTNPTFQQVHLEAQGREVVISTTLTNSFTEDLETMLLSGDTLIIRFEIDLLTVHGDSVVAMATWDHRFRYSLLEDRYRLYISETEDWSNLSTFAEAKDRWVSIRAAEFCDLEQLVPGQEYYLRMSAHMDNLRIPGLTDQLNLMDFWNRIRPSYVSPPFRKRSLIL